ncbi:MAG TPA: ArsA-related P-loop ATPase [Acidimicrobiales bacterium]|nr:ArsA-related P-loop ATPase [Acidimicrobiales bacterium]
MTTVRELAATRRVVVCCGSGGVGKTTTAAALAVEAAARGRRACVVTIDPARRLADALGLGELTNEPRRVEGRWPGELWALMLDTKTTFDAIVTRYSSSEEQAARIIDNRLYRNISGALSGTQEYMAMEKLHELHTTERFDLIVIDTPPTRNALDFLDAPRRITRFLDNRLFRLLIMPTSAYMRAVSAATQRILRTIARVVGAEVVDDAVAFFEAFEGMEQGFRDRAQAVIGLLSDDATAFVVVASPRRDAAHEAVFFADKLIEAGLGVDAVIVNRMQPSFGEREPALLEDASDDLRLLARNRRDFATLAASERTELSGLEKAADGVPIAYIPVLQDDVHDLTGLDAVRAHL